ncbi:MAG: molybdopterin molybdotransferase MoeA [Pseudomonadota bacterium]
MTDADAPPRRPANDCFALPPGVDWIEVGDAQARLRAATPPPVCAVETTSLDASVGRVLAADAIARRAHPAADNSAVDGYAFAHPGGPGGAEIRLPLVAGRAAAGAAFAGEAPPGAAVRIFTGAPMPAGTDTVALQEDARVEAGPDGPVVALTLPARPGANRRRMGENLAVGGVALPAGRRLGPAELAQAASAGLDRLRTRAPLRVAVLSTGDEIVSPGAADPNRPEQVIDANRPMLLQLLREMGCAPVDLGVAPDDRGALEAKLAEGARAADAVVASGGASGGDEDHMARALNAAAQARGGFHLWRVAMKPGRPLALGTWEGRPVFGLPGNPIAAFVCFLLFARPALLALAGAPWPEPRPLAVPSGFAHAKKPGRREFLRVRLGPDGRLEKFRSEGSGLIESLIWSDGLADLAHDAGPVAPGDPVAYLPYPLLGVRV